MNIFRYKVYWIIVLIVAVVALCLPEKSIFPFWLNAVAAIMSIIMLSVGDLK